MGACTSRHTDIDSDSSCHEGESEVVGPRLEETTVDSGVIHVRGGKGHLTTTTSTTTTDMVVSTIADFQYKYQSYFREGSTKLSLRASPKGCRVQLQALCSKYKITAVQLETLFSKYVSQELDSRDGLLSMDTLRTWFASGNDDTTDGVTDTATAVATARDDATLMEPFFSRLITMCSLTDGSKVYFDDFVNLVCSLCLLSSERMREFVFSSFDPDMLGYINPTRFNELLHVTSCCSDLPEDIQAAMICFREDLVNDPSALFGRTSSTSKSETSDLGLGYEDFCKLTQFYPHLLWPATRLQLHIQNSTLGLVPWVSVVKRQESWRHTNRYHPWSRAHMNASPLSSPSKSNASSHQAAAVAAATNTSSSSSSTAATANHQNYSWIQRTTAGAQARRQRLAAQGQSVPRKSVTSPAHVMDTERMMGVERQSSMEVSASGDFEYEQPQTRIRGDSNQSNRSNRSNCSETASMDPQGSEVHELAQLRMNAEKELAALPRMDMPVGTTTGERARFRKKRFQNLQIVTDGINPLKSLPSACSGSNSGLNDRSVSLAARRDTRAEMLSAELAEQKHMSAHFQRMSSDPNVMRGVRRKHGRRHRRHRTLPRKQDRFDDVSPSFSAHSDSLVDRTRFSNDDNLCSDASKTDLSTETLTTDRSLATDEHTDEQTDEHTGEGTCTDTGTDSFSSRDDDDDDVSQTDHDDGGGDTDSWSEENESFHPVMLADVPIAAAASSRSQVLRHLQQQQQQQLQQQQQQSNSQRSHIPHQELHHQSLSIRDSIALMRRLKQSQIKQQIQQLQQQQQQLAMMDDPHVGQHAYRSAPYGHLRYTSGPWSPQVSGPPPTQPPPVQYGVMEREPPVVDRSRSSSWRYQQQRSTMSRQSQQHHRRGEIFSG